MITRNSLAKQWLDTVMESYKRNDPGIVEKSIMALTLLEQLSVEGLDFIFKGGTSLMLLLGNFNRFSLDIDILLPYKPENLEDIFNKICSKGIFKNCSEDKRKAASNVPKVHYSFAWDSIIDGTERTVLLDILFQETGNRELLKIPIKHRVIETVPPEVPVKVQSVDALLGDKLTAFAPNTTGIPYDVEKDIEIIKQLFDLGILFDNLDNLNSVHTSFTQNCLQELSYRQLRLSEEEVLNDCFDTALTLVYRGAYKAENFSRLMTGIRGFRNFVFNSSYSQEDAIRSAAKVMYLVQAILSGKDKCEKFETPEDVRELIITDLKWSKLNKIKKTDPEAFFYLFSAVKLLGG